MRASKTLLHSCVLSALLLSSNAYSGSVNDKLNDLHKRLHKMEASQKETGENVQVHGLVEVEYGYSEDYSGVNSSDIVLATVELAIEASVNDNVDVQVSLLHEEDDTPLEVDVGVISLHSENSPIELHLGQMYIPFGAFETHQVSDPLTLELGETRESSILIHYDNSGLKAGFYLFNGDIEEGADEDKANKFGVNLGFESDSFSAGVDYISAISDTDAIQDILTSPIVEQVAGLSAHAAFSTDTLSVIFEYVGAMDSFDATDLAFNGLGAEPSAMNLEFAMSMPMAGNDSTIAIGYQTTDEALSLDLPETRILLVFSTEIYDSTSLAFEYNQSTDYDLADGGTEESSDTYTIQLATEF